MKGVILLALLSAAQLFAEPYRLLASFETGAAPFKPSSLFGGYELSSQHATHGNHAILWKKGYLAWKGAQDWTGYDRVTFSAFNPAQTPFEGVIEIMDSSSKNYWTRANVPFIAPPGSSTISLPTTLYTGEKSRPGRKLNTSEITELILSRADPAAQSRLYVDEFALIATAFPTPPDIRAFDFGPAGSPIFPGMIGLSASDTFNDDKGFGFARIKNWAPYLQAEDALQPDSLYRDSILLGEAEFLVRVPDGLYDVQLVLDHPGGFWGGIPLLQKAASVCQQQTCRR